MHKLSVKSLIIRSKGKGHFHCGVMMCNAVRLCFIILGRLSKISLLASSELTMVWSMTDTLMSTMIGECREPSMLKSCVCMLFLACLKPKKKVWCVNKTFFTWKNKVCNSNRVCTYFRSAWKLKWYFGFPAPGWLQMSYPVFQTLVNVFSEWLSLHNFSWEVDISLTLETRTVSTLYLFLAWSGKVISCLQLQTLDSKVRKQSASLRREVDTIPEWAEQRELDLVRFKPAGEWYFVGKKAAVGFLSRKTGSQQLVFCFTEKVHQAMKKWNITQHTREEHNFTKTPKLIN